MALAANSLEGKTQPFLQRIENLLSKITKIKENAAEECKPLLEDIDTVYDEAEEEGVPRRALKGLVRHRVLARKQAEIKNKIKNLDDRAAYEHLCEALGPLGQAAAVAAGFSDIAAPAPAE